MNSTLVLNIPDNTVDRHHDDNAEGEDLGQCYKTFFLRLKIS
jgi:hypothetical protein